MRIHRGDGERILAIFIDFENVGLGFGGRRDRFSIEKVLERIVEKGKIVAKKAYADWSRFAGYAASLHAAAVELIEIPKRNQTGKNSADIRMCVDAMDLAYSKDHIDTFVIVSGDSDFSPLVSKLKELGKHVIGLGLTDSTSNLLRDNCDEFLYYEDLDRAPLTPLVEDTTVPEPKRKAFALLLDSLLALRRENKELIYSSMVKDTMKRKRPSFNEEYHGYRSFSDLLEDAQRHGLIDLEKHKNSGTYVVTRFGSEPRVGPVPAQPPRVVTLPPPPAALPPRVAALPPAQAAVREAPPPSRTERPPTREAPPARSEPRAPSRREPIEPARPRPAPPKPAPAPVAEAPEDDEDNGSGGRVFGRALIEDVFDEMGADEVPSYQPRKSKPAAAKPEPAEAAKPKPTRSAEPRRAAKPAATAAAPVKKAPARSEGAAPRSRANGAAPESPRPAPVAATPKPAPQPKPPAKPKPVDDDDSFGAGLD